MVNKEIMLLESQIEKLSYPGFDFDAWKEYSLIILTRIFGKHDSKIKQLKNIEFEFNSWSLRDASGNESYEEGSKKLAKEVMQAAIDELKIYGLPDIDNNAGQEANEILTIILDEFKGSQLKEFNKIIKSKNSLTEKKRRVKELIEELGDFASIDIISNILTSPKVSSFIIKKK